jgi:hypothetical protein
VPGVAVVDWSGASRAQRRWVLVALALAAAVRGAMLAAKWRTELRLNDSLWYSAQAVKLAAGDGFVDPFYGGPSAEHGPLTPLLVAPVSWIDDPVPWQRVVMTVVGLAVVAGIGLLAHRVAGWWAAALAVTIAAVYPNLWMNDSLVMSETPAALCVVAALVLALGLVMPDDAPDGASGTPGRPAWRAVACGVVIGLAALARSELVLLVPLLGFVVWRRTGHRPALLLCAGSAAVLAPWVGANLLRFERPVLLTTNDGTTLLGANCHETYYGAGIGGWSLFCVVDEGAPEGEDPGVRSARHRRLAFDYAREHAERLPLVALARVGRGLDVVGIENQVAGDVGEERYRWASWSGVVTWWVVAAVAVVGLRRIDGPARAVLLAPVIAVGITTVLFYGAHRIRSPLEPVVTVAAAVAVAGVVERRFVERRVAG